MGRGGRGGWIDPFQYVLLPMRSVGEGGAGVKDRAFAIYIDIYMFSCFATPLGVDTLAAKPPVPRSEGLP